MPEQPFSILAAEFNAAADNWVNGTLNPDALAARFALLMRHCTENDEQKRQLTEKYFDATLAMLSKPLAFGPYDALSAGYKDHMCIALEALKHESAISCLPKRAPREIASAGIAILDQVERGNLDKEEKAVFYTFAYMMNSYADVFAAAIAARTYETSTAQPIAAARPIILKPKPAEAS